ncbi:uncharacterized protein LOC144577974 [Callithrix jacchus]
MGGPATLKPSDRRHTADAADAISAWDTAVAPPTPPMRVRRRPSGRPRRADRVADAIDAVSAWVAADPTAPPTLQTRRQFHPRPGRRRRATDPVDASAPEMPRTPTGAVSSWDAAAKPLTVPRMTLTSLPRHRRCQRLGSR